MIDKDKARLNPSEMFKAPQNVLQHRGLSREEKIDILRRWAYDQKELEVASEENMMREGKEDESALSAISKALLELGVFEKRAKVLTKHG